MMLYKEIETRLNKINFDNLFPGFKKYDFALYNKDTVYFKDKTIPWDNRFIGNTSIMYEGKYIAIWNIEYRIDNLDIFTSKIVHEMFHAYQLEHQETRWANEFEALEYKYDESNITTKINESELLTNNQLEEMVYLREQRKKTYPKEIEYETKIETIEGMARYVELESLMMLDEISYKKELANLKEMIITPKNYIPIRHISYEIGAYLLILAKTLDIDFTHHIGKEDQTIYDIIKSSLSPKKYTDIFEYNLEYIKTYKDEVLCKIVEITKDNNYKTIDKITGLDPLNTFKVNDMIYCKHFVRYEKEDNTYFEFNPSVYSVKDKKLYFK